MSDELNLKLMRRIRKAAADAAGDAWVAHAADAVIDRMLDEFERPGKLEGAGFYEYADGKRMRLWPGLREAFPPVEDPSSINLKDLQERMLFIEALETIKCVDEGVIESVADANIGSIMGIGFPGWSGGVLQYINGYEGGVPASSPAPASSRRTTATASRRPSRWRRARNRSRTPRRRSPPLFRSSLKHGRCA